MRAFVQDLAQGMMQVCANEGDRELGLMMSACIRFEESITIHTTRILY